jgi:hypothetical protein
MYDEYRHIGCNTVFDSGANTAVGEALHVMSSGPPLSQEQGAAVVTLKASYRFHLVTKNARTRLGYIRLTKGRPRQTLMRTRFSPNSRRNAFARYDRTQSHAIFTYFDKRLLTAH